jgi:hypothetical protein
VTGNDEKHVTAIKEQPMTGNDEQHVISNDEQHMTANDEQLRYILSDSQS